MKSGIGDIVELIRDIPEQHLQAGMWAAVVHCHDDAVYELEFSDEQEETELETAGVRVIPPPPPVAGRQTTALQRTRFVRLYPLRRT